jgi:hypothetical protein
LGTDTSAGFWIKKQAGYWGEQSAEFVRGSGRHLILIRFLDKHKRKYNSAVFSPAWSLDSNVERVIYEADSLALVGGLQGSLRGSNPGLRILCLFCRFAGKTPRLPNAISSPKSNGIPLPTDGDNLDPVHDAGTMQEQAMARP